MIVRKWLLIIDDLHRRDYGKINQKIKLLDGILDEKRFHILTVSRLNLNQIVEKCPDERRITAEFHEVQGIIDSQRKIDRELWE